MMHLHSDQGVAVSAHKDGLLPLTQHALIVLPQLAYHDYEGIALNLEERERIVADLGQKKLLMLRNHGPVVLAKTLQQTFITQWSLQRACEIQMATLSMGRPPIHVGEDVVKVHQRDLSQVNAGGNVGEADFAAWTRRIDRIDRSWRD